MTRRDASLKPGSTSSSRPALRFRLDAQRKAPVTVFLFLFLVYPLSPPPFTTTTDLIYRSAARHSSS